MWGHRNSNRPTKCRWIKPAAFLYNRSIMNDYLINRDRGSDGCFVSTGSAQTYAQIYARHKAYAREHPEMYREAGRKFARTSRGHFNGLKTCAKRRGFSVNITFLQYSKITEGKNCCYCDGPLPKAGHGLDRKNSQKGYSLKNCVPCCTTCNRIRGKDDISYEEMFEVIKLLRRLRRKKNA
jgi:hypothetical protein